jgi:hypothetical protein
VAGVLDGLQHELGEAHVVEVETHRPGVVATDLEEILDQLAEAPDLLGDQIDGLAGPVGQLVALALQHLHGCRHRHQR